MVTFVPDPLTSQARVHHPTCAAADRLTVTMIFMVLTCGITCSRKKLLNGWGPASVDPLRVPNPKPKSSAYRYYLPGHFTSTSLTNWWKLIIRSFIRCSISFVAPTKRMK